MYRNGQRKIALFVTSIVIALGLNASVFAAEAEDSIKYRKSVMKAIGGHAGAIGAIMQGKVDHSNHLSGHAAGLNMAAKMARDVFPPESATGDTEVTSAVWDKPDEFNEAVTQLEDATAAFVKSIDSGDQAQMGAALKEVFGSCKNCHDNFRKKKE